MILGTVSGNMVLFQKYSSLPSLSRLYQEKYGSAKDFLSKPFSQPCIWGELWLKY